jgi:hypothetical protein
MATATQAQSMNVKELFKTEPEKALDLTLAETTRLQAELRELQQLSTMLVGKEGLEATNSSQLWWLAGIYFHSGAAPMDDMVETIDGKKRWRTEREVRARLFIKMSFGAELGLKPLQAIQNIMIVNNRPSIFGDAAKALVLDSGLCEYCYEEEVGSPGTNPNNVNPSWGFKCITKRKGQKEESYTFTWGDAMMAGLVAKPKSLYKLYPKRMLMFRARGFRLRDTYPDVMKGLITVEEAQDLDHRRDTPTIRPTMDELLGNTPGADKPAREGDVPSDDEQDKSTDNSQPFTPPLPEATPRELATGDATELPPTADAKAEDAKAEDEAVTIAQWREEVQNLETMIDCANARKKIPKEISEAGAKAIKGFLSARETAIRGGRGERPNK